MPTGVHNGHRANSGSFQPGIVPRNRGTTKRVCVICGTPVRRTGKRCLRCYSALKAANKQTADEKRQKHRDWLAIVKDEVFKVYGGYVCVCCGETERVFLVLDHVNGGGNAERRRIHNKGTRGGAGQYHWLKKQKYPSGYQVLCHNCNFAKTRGECPHASSVKSATGSNGK